MIVSCSLAPSLGWITTCFQCRNSSVSIWNGFHIHGADLSSRSKGQQRVSTRCPGTGTPGAMIKTLSSQALPPHLKARKSILPCKPHAYEIYSKHTHCCFCTENTSKLMILSTLEVDALLSISIILLAMKNCILNRQSITILLQKSPESIQFLITQQFHNTKVFVGTDATRARLRNIELENEVIIHSIFSEIMILWGD